MNTSLSSKNKEILLGIAREAIDNFVTNGAFSPPSQDEPSLLLRCGCFVTIKEDGQLRGCIGNFQSDRPLFEEVAQTAISSATKDPRFYPMQQEDLASYKLEISVLSPLERIENVEGIEVGTHGIYLQKGIHRGVLLPQVATERNWDKMTFLRQTCLKANLPEDAWQSPDMEIYIFDAQVFGE